MKIFLNGCIILSFFLIACSKGGQSAGSTDLPPTNLTVSATAVPDSSGNVNITASASNAVTYDIDLGNGVIQTSATGLLTYKYSATGNYTINVVAKSSSGQTASANTTIAVGIKRNLIWSDEFNTDGAPDPNKWGYDLGGGGWGNSEQEYYTNRSQNAVVQNGVLKITVLKESYNGSSYTSARLLSKNKFAFTYGHVDIRAQLPSGQGPWPALWMLGSNVDTMIWPACGEIDIMEQNGSNSNKIYGTLHYPGHSGANGNGNTTIIANATTSFHIYSLDWSPSAIKIYVDGNLFQTVANSSSIPFNHDFFVILNVAMGGTFGGSVDPAITSATMQVDYIRVYQ
ncbi:glycosyl hydrolase family 16 [Mucilaginibacter gracilis]|uniref:Glycosyl hydrolase family 16 n=1 Tax=Mucilaginibacter gracilis TaxID=423350 RepID=A0A495J757_9SPHI|nr:family 16 glycosylhydrolase [Mucilaginibacter gracilis]RKR84561.1 glycosyl hydrolase family 16 [Mucilaginibacter gracilis]